MKDLVRDLERLLGERAAWDTATARALFDALAPGRSGRRRSPDHERVFWQLAGFCLRPGFGDPGDPARIALLAPLASERLSFPDQARGWQQFWIAWRRVAAGMGDVHQIALRDLADPWLAPSEARAKMKKQKGAKPLADPEMLDMVASLERVPAARRAELGGWILERTWTDRDPRLWAAIGRLGARVPAYASVDHVVGAHVAERWIEQILREKWDQVPGAAEAAVALARVTGDRARDLAEPVRREVARRLTAIGAIEAHVRAVLELVAVEEQERAAFWGEEVFRSVFASRKRRRESGRLRPPRRAVSGAAAAAAIFLPRPARERRFRAVFPYRDADFLLAGESEGGWRSSRTASVPAKKAPLVVILHGVNTDQVLHMWFGTGGYPDVATIAAKAVASGASPPYILAAPSQTKMAMSGRRMWQDFDLGDDFRPHRRGRARGARGDRSRRGLRPRAQRRGLQSERRALARRAGAVARRPARLLRDRHVHGRRERRGARERAGEREGVGALPGRDLAAPGRPVPRQLQDRGHGGGAP